MSTMTRRYFFERVGAGFLGAAIGYLWTHDGLITSSTGADKEEGPLGQIAPRLPVRVNSVIFLFMCGGVSHIDTFDPKDNGHAGKMIDAVCFGANQATMLRPGVPPLPCNSPADIWALRRPPHRSARERFRWKTCAPRPRLPPNGRKTWPCFTSSMRSSESTTGRKWRSRPG